MKDDMTIGYPEPEEALLPDGWQDGDDIFAGLDEKSGSADDFVADGPETKTVETTSEREPNAQDDVDALTMGGEAESEAGTAAGEIPEAATPDEVSKPTERAPRILKLQVNHKDETVNLDEMSDSDLVALLQKGRAFDNVRDAENKRKYRETYQEQVDSGMTEAVARLVAAASADGKTYSLTDEEEPKEETPKTAGDVVHGTGLAGDIQQLKILYPDFTEMPDEVAQALAQGVPLLTAYSAYKVKEGAKAATALKRENAVLKQNAAAAAKAPVRGVSGSGDVAPAKRDYFAEGFDSDPW